MARLCGLLAMLLCAVLPSPVSAEEIVRLPSADGATLPYLLSADLPAAATKPQIVAILFNGGEGVIGLTEKGIPQPGGNFLVRWRKSFVARGIPVGLIDVPSDSQGMSDHFRMSQRHFDDVAAVADDLQRRFPGTRLFLIGTSRGTVSAGYAGAALAPRLAGVVLTSSIFKATRAGSGLAGFDFTVIKTPLLFVHHVDDSCHVTPYFTAKSLAEKYPLISVKGGKEPRSGPCDPFSPHGYFGKETETVNAIVDWMMGKPYPANIE
jgi:pimeloyl-ACP methyl ester carboxylesterase